MTGIRTRLRSARALLAALLVAVVALPFNTMAQDGDPILSGRLKCNSSDLRCWYMVGAVGEAPRRLAFIGRNIDPLVDGMRRVELIQVIDQRDYKHRFVIWQLEVDCNRASFRVERDRAGNSNGTVTDEAVENGQWQAFAEARYGESSVQGLACSAGQPDPGTTLFVGNAYRAPDVVHHFRSVFWSQ